MLYPRDPSLDPQLVWKGKDEQDRQDLAVPVVPIYIQEKIHPQAIIDASAAHRASAGERSARASSPTSTAARRLRPEGRLLPPRAELVEPHDPRRFAAGDDSPRREGRAQGQGADHLVDPPYGIKFGSNWQVSTRKREVKDGKAEDATRQPEQVRAFREPGSSAFIRIWPTSATGLSVARELLTETGSVFVQIGDENVHLVRCVLDEVFGSENFVVADHRSASTGGLGSSGLDDYVRFLLWYAKDGERREVSPTLCAREDCALPTQYSYDCEPHRSATSLALARARNSPGQRCCRRARFQPDRAPHDAATGVKSTTYTSSRLTASALAACESATGQRRFRTG